MSPRKSGAQCASQRPWVREKKTKGRNRLHKDNDQHQAQRGFEHFVDAPGAVAKNGEADDHGDGGRDQLRQESPWRARRARASLRDAAPPSARRRRCCPEIRARGISQSPGRDGPRRRPASAGRTAAPWRCWRRSCESSSSRTWLLLSCFSAATQRSFNQPGTASGARGAIVSRGCAISPLIALVIVAAQMQDAVQDQNLNFLARAVAKRMRVLRGDLR